MLIARHNVAFAKESFKKHCTLHVCNVKTYFAEQLREKLSHHPIRVTRRRTPLSPLDRTGWSVFAIHTRTESFSGTAKANFSD
jgi:hypothetical protein